MRPRPVSSTTPIAVVLALAASSGVACTPDAATPWALPEFAGAAAFLVQLRSGTTDQLVAFDRDDAPTPLPFATDADEFLEATVLALGHPLSAYAIAPGPQALVPRARSRAWPPLLGVAARRLADDGWAMGVRLEDTALADAALDAAPLCPPIVGEPWPLPLANPADLVALDATRALLATDNSLSILTAPQWALDPQPLPDAHALKALWLDPDGTLIAGTAVTSQVYVGAWDGAALRWTDRAELRSPANLVALTGRRGGPAFGVTNDGELMRVRTGPARAESMFSFQAMRGSSGGGVAVRGADAVLAYSNVEAGRLVFFDGTQPRTDIVSPGPLNLLVSVDGLGVVLGNALGFSVLAPDSATFAPLAGALLEPQALVGTRDGFVAFGTTGSVVRHDRRSGHTCAPQPIAVGELRVAVALDDETVLALEQPPQPGATMTAWYLRVPALPF